METSRLLVWGAGGHGRVVADLARTLGHQVVGFVERDPALLGQVVDPGGGRAVVAEAAFLADADAGRCSATANGITLGVGDNASRLACLRRIPSLFVPALIHPTAFVSVTARLGRGCVVLPQAVVHSAAELLEAVIVNSGAVVEHDCVLGAGAHVSPGAVLAGGVQVGEGTWIGAGAVVIQGCRIGRGAMVGAGAVVIRDVPDGATVVGNPARVIQQLSQ